ncbi:4563_t:CDS:2, partial [Dentiscutata erythropus]
VELWRNQLQNEEVKSEAEKNQRKGKNNENDENEGMLPYQEKGVKKKVLFIPQLRGQVVGSNEATRSEFVSVILNTITSLVGDGLAIFPQGDIEKNTNADVDIEISDNITTRI